MEARAHELTAAYALDALEPEEREAFEAHLATCERCQEELAMLREATDALAIAASGPEPAPALRDRILADVQAEAQVVVPLERHRRRTLAPVLGAAAAVAAVVALAIGLWAAQLSSDLDSTRDALERERAAASVLADPDARTVSLASGEGRLVVAGDGRAALVLDELGAAPEGKTYALWIVEDGTPTAAGLFPGADGTELVALDGVVDTGDVVAVTVEDGPVEAPESDPIVTSDPV